LKFRTVKIRIVEGMPLQRPGGEGNQGGSTWRQERRRKKLQNCNQSHRELKVMSEKSRARKGDN
jgi:hypothetical protein